MYSNRMKAGRLKAHIHIQANMPSEKTCIL